MPTSLPDSDTESVTTFSSTSSASTKATSLSDTSSSTSLESAGADTQEYTAEDINDMLASMLSSMQRANEIAKRCCESMDEQNANFNAHEERRERLLADLDSLDARSKAVKAAGDIAWDANAAALEENAAVFARVESKLLGPSEPSRRQRNAPRKASRSGARPGFFRTLAKNLKGKIRRLLA